MKNILIVLVMLSALRTDAQIGVSVFGGYSRLNHQTHFETSNLYLLYQFTALSFPSGEYTWEQFQTDYQIRSQYWLPRFGAEVSWQHKNLPVGVLGQVGTSLSSTERFSYLLGAGVVRDFALRDSALVVGGGAYFGYVFDGGWGAETLRNSIGNDQARELAATFYDPKKPLGNRWGRLIVYRASIARPVNEKNQIFVGITGAYDTTSKLRRGSRMNTQMIQLGWKVLL